jgi:hypothetical protein
VVATHPARRDRRAQPASTDRGAPGGDRWRGLEMTATNTKNHSEMSPADAARFAAPLLTADQLSELLALVHTSDSVELKATVPDTERRSVVAAFGMDPLAAQIRQVAFFDTLDLALNRSGVVVRARRIQGRPGDTVVKLRPVVPDTLSPTLRASAAFGVEVDAMPGGFVCSASMKGVAQDEQIKAVIEGSRPLRKLLSKEQRAFFRAHAPADTDLDHLEVLGPITIFKLKFKPPDFDRRIVAELWLYPDGARLLELSTKTTPAEAFEVAAATRALLGTKGVDLSAVQQTKTKTALDFFAAERVAGVAESEGNA